MHSIYIYYDKDNEQINQFQVGNNVRLASGGPKMTIESIFKEENDTMCVCIWFNKYDDVKTASFNLQTLIKEY